MRLGRARLAMVASLASGGRMAVRLGDDATSAELEWLGVAFDGTRHLSDTAVPQAEAVAVLQRSGRLYPCFETEDELRWKREQRIRRHLPPVYDRGMLKLTVAQRASAEAGGKRPYWRFRLSDTEIAWRDRVAGPQTIKLHTLSDPVVVAADGTIAASLAAAVDDVAQGITLLVRDATQIEASAAHLDILAALGGEPGRPSLAHLPALPDPIATLPLRRLRQDGVEPAALATLLAAPTETAPASPAALVAGFDLATAGRGVRSITLDRLRALNRLALASLPYPAAADRLPQGADEAFWLAVRGGIDLLGEARLWWDVVGDGFVPPVSDGMAIDAGALPPEPWDGTTWARWTAAMQDTSALRLALTGEESGPDMGALLPLIGRARAERRLRLACFGES